jgi:hypothetical protein
MIDRMLLSFEAGPVFESLDDEAENAEKADLCC